MADVRHAWDLAVNFYLKARSLDLADGKLHNQLAVVEEARQADGLGVCMGACMRFALASTAVKPLAAGEKNWMRCIGNHREALSESLSGRRLEKLSPECMCACHALMPCTHVRLSLYCTLVPQLIYVVLPCNW
jgi:hypothetical protein